MRKWQIISKIRILGGTILDKVWFRQRQDALIGIKKGGISDPAF